ncbi:pyridoxal phosphate-dependent aminotransferase [Salicibibacter cibi]|uniref:cysteine-S-conjugate beta-lyase n=1 Tax=Salicibibacter cibi TaxID=2743001 RepID=A0A7T6ZCZ8_9BACI|nr:MalY/PatB family protein [Salicibibacter cibi]QQK81248.1 pyridoxal phosphate-dependent aminotransferase [Salicibibacter cibi]
MNFDEIIERRNTNSMKWDQLEAKYQDSELWPMWVADMDFRAPEPVLKALDDVTRHGVFGYHHPPHSLRQAIQDWTSRRFGWDIKPEAMTFTPGVVPAIHHLINAYTDEGDGIIIQTPVYFPFFALLRSNRRTLLENRLVEGTDGKYEIDFDDLEAHMKNGAKMIILCNPHNPVGRVWSESELTKIAELCARYDVTVVSDEIHADVILQGNHTPFAKLETAKDLQVATCMAPSKTFNLASLQLSYVIFNDGEMQKRLEQQMQQNFTGIGNPYSSAAAEAAYRHGEPWLEELLSYVQGNVDYVNERLQTEMPSIGFVKPEATYLLWLDFRKLELTQDDLQNWLRKEGKIALNDGHTFGKAGSGFARMNVACPREHVVEGMNRLKTAYDKKMND